MLTQIDFSCDIEPNLFLSDFIILMSAVLSSVKLWDEKSKLQLNRRNTLYTLGQTTNKFTLTMKVVHLIKSICMSLECKD